MPILPPLSSKLTLRGASYPGLTWSGNHDPQPPDSGPLYRLVVHGPRRGRARTAQGGQPARGPVAQPTQGNPRRVAAVARPRRRGAEGHQDRSGSFCASGSTAWSAHWSGSIPARISSSFTPGTPAATGTIRLENRSGVSATVLLAGRSYVVPPLQSVVVPQYAGNFTYEVLAEGYGVIRPALTRALGAGETFSIFINPESPGQRHPPFVQAQSVNEVPPPHSSLTLWTWTTLSTHGHYH